MKNQFVHLHVHTEYSLLDGAIRIPDLVKRTKELGMEALAITDHGNMSGVISFYKACRDAEIKPIIGCEVYVAPRSRFSKNGKPDAQLSHLTLLAKNKQGYQNLLKIVTSSHLEGFYYKPRVDKELLKNHHHGIICLSGCMNGEAIGYVLGDDYEKSKQVLINLQEIFGDDFYIEVHRQNIDGQEKAMQGLFSLSEELSIPCIATNDSHYLNKEDAAAHDVLLCIQTNKPFDAPDRLRFSTQEFSFKSPQEMYDLFKDHEEAVKKTMEIANKVNLDLELGVLRLPNFDLPNGETPDKYLKKLAQEGLKNIYGESEKAKKKLEDELSIIKKMGYASYFLITADLINFAKKSGIQVGPGRGSAAGSITAYALGITNVDPLKYGLLFERFLNPERVSMPDIDIDFCIERRGEVLDYVTKKYGEDHVAQIITFGTMAARAAVRDVGRILKVPLPQVDRIAKLIPFGLSISQALETNPELKTIYDADEEITMLIDMAKTLEGISRHASTHAAGVVISKEPLIEHVPLQQNEGQTVTQYAMGELEDTGLLKMDFLGLRNLTMIEYTLKIIQEAKQITIDLNSIPFDDENTYRLLSQAETFGVFQLESPGMRTILKDLRTNRFEDIIALLALHRPGPLGSGMVDEFIKRKHGKVKIKYDLEALEPILAETYGVILYQEQVMEIASKLAGFTMGQADLLRRAMGKKKSEEMRKLKESFINGCKKNRLLAKAAENIFDLCAKFAEYGFNKSHSTAYAIISYQTAYLKANFPLEFMTALLTSISGSTDKVSSYITECRRMRIAVLPPDINESKINFAISKEAIRFGLAAVKNVGDIAALAIINEREKNGPFKNLLDLVSRCEQRTVNKRVVESLIKAGAMDLFRYKRSQMLSALDKIISQAEILQKENANNQINLFADMFKAQDSAFELPAIEEFSPDELLRMEKDMLGLYVSDHPLNYLKAILQKRINISTAGLINKKAGSLVIVGGLLEKIKTFVTRNRQLMAKAVLEDLEGSAEIIIFPKTYEKFSSLLLNDTVVTIKGKVDLREDEPKIIAEQIIPLQSESEEEDLKKTLHIEFDHEVEEENLIKVKNLLKLFKGAVPVYLHRQGKTYSIDRDLWVNINPAIVASLEELLGRGRVWFS